MRVGECEVWITCEGERLPEYDTQPEGDDGKTFACFVPSDAGKKFVLEWQNNSAGDVLLFRMILDGTRARGTWCRPQKKGTMMGMYTGPTIIQPFLFSQLETTDADDVLHAPANVDLGTIRVEVTRVRLKSVTQPTHRKFTLGFHPVGPVHERSKKLGVHCVTLGEATETTPLPAKKWKVIDRDEGPVARFLFRYRPLALLQAQDIAPLPIRSPEPPHPSPKRQEGQDNDARPAKRQRIGTARSDNIVEMDVKPDISKLSDDDSDEDDLSVLKDQLSQIMGKINKMEQKKKRRKDDGSVRVKKEEPVASSSRLGTGSGDIIDLTLSD